VKVIILGGAWEIRQSDNAGNPIPEETREEMREGGKYWGESLKEN
jgi:hypothetical protein